jgi:hypothetical protein
MFSSYITFFLSKVCLESITFHGAEVSVNGVGGSGGEVERCCDITTNSSFPQTQTTHQSGKAEFIRSTARKESITWR